MYTGQVKKDPDAKTSDDYLPDGLGKIKWPNGDRYDGQFTLGKPQGQGTKTNKATGTVIQGNFMFGQACG